MNRFLTTLALIACTVSAQQKCSKLTCASDEEKVDDPNESNSKYCICQKKAPPAPTCDIATCVTDGTEAADWK